MSEKTLWTLIVLAAVALVGILAWRRGLFAKVFPPPNVPGLPFPGGLGPKEMGPPAVTFGSVCNAAYSTVGRAASQAPDPRVAAGGVAAQTLGPVICATHEYVAGKVWDGSKWVAKNAIAPGAKGVAKAGEKVWNATLGKIF